MQHTYDSFDLSYLLLSIIAPSLSSYFSLTFFILFYVVRSNGASKPWFCVRNVNIVVPVSVVSLSLPLLAYIRLLRKNKFVFFDNETSPKARSVNIIANQACAPIYQFVTLYALTNINIDFYWRFSIPLTLWFTCIRINSNRKWSKTKTSKIV